MQKCLDQYQKQKKLYFFHLPVLIHGAALHVLFALFKSDVFGATLLFIGY